MQCNKFYIGAIVFQWTTDLCKFFTKYLNEFSVKSSVKNQCFGIQLRVVTRSWLPVYISNSSQQSTMPNQQRPSTDSHIDARCKAICYVCAEGELAVSEPSVQCMKCSCHVACLVMKHKESTRTSLRNSLDWLGEFIEKMHFHFFCDACDVEYGKLLALRNQMSGINAKMGEIDQQIKAMQVHVLSSSRNVDQITVDLSEGTAVDNVQFQDHAAASVSTSTSTSRPLSKHVLSAAAVAGDLSQVIKSAIVKSIREQKAADHDKASVAIHGMREHGNDISDVRDLYEYTDCNVRVVSTTRIGSSAKSTKRPHLLKVSHHTFADKKLFLQASKFLKDDASTAFMFITPWLSPYELTKLRIIQSQCRQLNGQAPCGKDDKKAFVVISRKLMELIVKEALHPFRDSGSTRPGAAANKGIISSKRTQTKASANPKANTVASTSTASGSQAGIIDQQPSLKSKNGLGGNH